MTVTRCPCCGALVEQKLVVDLNTNTIAANGKQVVAFPTSVVLAHTLVKAGARSVPMDGLLRALYGDPTNEPRHAVRGVYVHAYNLRRSLKKIGWRLVCVRGAGYRLAPCVERKA